MSASNWVGDNRDMSPERNNRYRIDDVGLQLGLGLPLQLLGVGSMVSEFSQSRSYGRRMMGLEPFKRGNSALKPKEEEIHKTVDGIPIRKVYITNINIEVEHQEIYYIFGQFGQVVNVYLRVSKNDNLKKFAFVTFLDPKDAAKVLWRRRFPDLRGRSMYATAADSWHQPKEGPDGRMIWKVDRRTQVKEEEESEEDEQTGEVVAVVPVQSVIDNEVGLNILNDDCLMYIFSYLSYKEISGIERVCKRWQGLSFRMWRCLHELNYSKPTFSGMETTTQILEQYLRRCGEVLSLLDLDVKNQAFNESTLAVIAKYCCNLEVLRVSNIQIGNRSLAHLGRCCPKLKQLVMDGCTKFNDLDLMSLLPKCTGLTHLDLSRSHGITGKCLANIDGPVTDLKLSSCPSVETSHLIAGLQRMSNSLRNLTLSASGNMRGSEVDKIVSAVPNLTSLSLCHCLPNLDPKSLSSVGRLSQLSNLDLSMNGAVNDAVLMAIIEGCESLTKVNLCGSGGGCVGVLSDLGLSMLARLRKLTDLDISYLEATNNTTLKNISSRSVRLKRLLCRGCPEITDEGSSPVLSMCNELELFDLSGCNLIGESTMLAAVTSVNMRTNNVPLKLIVGGTNVQSVVVDKKVPLLTVDLSDLSEEHMRPDFMNEMFFPPSDSDEEEELDHLCERIGCDCDFDFDDLYDPTQCFPYEFDDDTPKFGATAETEEFFIEYNNDDDDDDDDGCAIWVEN